MLEALLLGSMAVYAAGWFWTAVVIVIFLIGVLISSFEEDGTVWLMLFPLFIIPPIISGYTFFPFVWVFENPGTSFGILLEYFAVGAVYAIFRWVYNSFKQGQHIRDNLLDIQRCYSESSINYKDFKDYLIKRNYISRLSDCKMKIAVWVVWWPLSIVSFFFKNLLLDFMNTVANTFYTMFGGTFRKLQDMVLEHVLGKDTLDYKKD